MAEKKIERPTYRTTANVLSIIMIFFIGAVYIIETMRLDLNIDYSYTALVIAAILAIVITILRRTVNYYKLAFNIPFVLSIYYLLLMTMCNWSFNHYFFICFVFCALSCMYSHFYRTLTFIIFQNILIGYLVSRGVPIAGHETSLFIVLTSWFLFILGGISMLFITRAGTVKLNRALESRSSFMDLLASTENYVAMVDERNEVIYASNTLAELSNIEDAALMHGRPLLDLFPGKALKVYAGTMLKEKSHHTADWEFTLDGQKRYFKVSSQSLRGHSGGSLINLYDMTHLAERDEIAAMKDSMMIGLFFMDKDSVIQDHYSRYLEEMLVEKELQGRLFTDVIAASVSGTEMSGIKDYFGMVMERSYDQEMLDDINPLNELHYVNKRTGDRKVFQCTFTPVERGQGEVFLLVTIYDITARVELQQRLAEEEQRRQEEMQSVFELIQVEPAVFADFTEDMEQEFDTIDKILKDSMLSAHDVLVKVYQSVHAIKSNAVILGLNVFGNKVHNLESKIKKLRESDEEVPFAEMLNLTMDIEKLSEEREKFKEIIGKLQSYSGSGNIKQNVNVIVDSLAKAAEKASMDIGKNVKFAAKEIDSEAINSGPRRVMKDILMQLVRNSVVHGIEFPDERLEKGKKETGVIVLSIKMTEDKKHIHIKLSDDGRGLNYKRIAEKALDKGLISKEEAENTDALVKAIFLPGFSTAETEDVHAGRGIGLNLVKDRVKELNGNIKLRSEKDKGTVFFISIPTA